MSVRFITSVLSIGALVSTLSAAPASAGDRDDVGRFLGAAATLFIIGKIIQSETNDGRHHTAAPVRQRDVVTPRRQTPRAHRPVVAPRRADLPRQCLIAVNGGATNYVLGKRCVERNYRSANRLPGACKVTLRGNRADRVAYSLRCLRRDGYQVAAR